MVYLTDEEVELFGEINFSGTRITYNGKCYKICRVTNEGYYINELKDAKYTIQKS